MEEVKKQCADMDAQWDERQKTRAEETEAISKAPCLEKLLERGEVLQLPAGRICDP